MTMRYSIGFQNVIYWVERESLGNLWEIQVLSPNADLVSQELWELSPANCALTNLPGSTLKEENH